MACSHWLHRAVSMVVAGVTFGLAVSLTAQIIQATDELEPTPAGSEMEAIPPEENAAEWLMAGGCAIDPTDYSRGAIGEASVRPFSEWSPELVDSVRQSLDRQQATRAQRQLVSAAIALRRVAITDGAYPADRAAVPELAEPDPFTGRPLAYTIREDGSAEVALDGADELLSEIVAKSAASIPPIVLPAP